MKKQFSKIAALSTLKKSLLLILMAGIIFYAFALPKQLFTNDYSTVLLDKNGELLGAKISNDGQWRFPEVDSVPSKIEICLLQFEDKNFYYHPGIDMGGVLRAFKQNIKRKKVVSGAITITMQTIRLIRKNPARTFTEKFYEMILATRLELSYSKKSILKMYASHAPFGNNVVGLNAASWRYFGKNSAQLSWAESATLAVLPNAPGLIYPGKNHQRLMTKRNKLLTKLLTQKIIDSTSYQLAIAEALPNKPLPLPQFAPHLLQKILSSNGKAKLNTTTIDLKIQQQALQILQNHYPMLVNNKIYNGAIIIRSAKNGKLLAYIGNIEMADKEHSKDVNCAEAARSTGSVLKPILYEKCLEAGLITPQALLPDIPVQYGTFSPKNYNKSYDGAVPASQALARSLNIPMIKLLNDYGLAKFHNDLKLLGIQHLQYSSSHYGLSLILGGAEISLSDLNLTYTKMAMQLNSAQPASAQFKMDKACVFETLNALTQLNRPDEEGNWKAFESSKKIAWKTGTSFGNRDAWSTGITPEYVISVWIGNADGEGRTGLTGINYAAPIMFDLFSVLNTKNSWFNKPNCGFSTLSICTESGYRATENCEQTTNISLPSTCLQAASCMYHKNISISKLNGLRVDADCELISNIISKKYFVLPPLIEKYYVLKHPEYAKLPAFNKDCITKANDKAMGIIYPKSNSKIIIPNEIDGAKGRAIFEASHKNSSTKIYWHLDNEFVGETTHIHQLEVNPAVGKHLLTLVDENGITLNCKFEVLK